MSGKSCASSARSGSLRVPTTSTTTGANHDLALDALYDRKRDNKSVRVLTVIIYVFCVSLAAIMLSLYYVFFWEPKDTQRKVARTVDRQTSTTPMPTCFMPLTGGRNTTVSNVNPTPTNVSLPTPDRDVTAAALVNSTSTENDLTEAFNSTSELLNLNSTQDLTNYTETNAT